MTTVSGGVKGLVARAQREAQRRAQSPSTAYLLLVMLRDLPVFRTVIPSKLFEFWAQERPIVLAAPEGECRSLLEEDRSGYAIPPEDAASLAKAIRRVLDQPDDTAARARRGRERVERDFLRDELARRMARFLERVIEAR